jgi:hypothetical protein
VESLESHLSVRALQRDALGTISSTHRRVILNVVKDLRLLLRVSKGCYFRFGDKPTGTSEFVADRQIVAALKGSETLSLRSWLNV